MATLRNTATLSGQDLTMTATDIRQYNNLVDQIQIAIPNSNDGITLSDYNVFVQTRARGFVNKVSLSETTTGDDDTYTVYVWTLTSTDTSRSGTLEFEIQLEHKTDDDIPIWQSEVCSAITVLSNIADVDKSQPETVGVLSQLYQELTAYNETAGADATTATEQATIAIKAAETATEKATEANAEVTDAHVSAAKNKTFTNIKNRFEEIESGNYLPATNAIANGDFSNGTTSWGAGSSAVNTVLDNTLYITGSGTSSAILAYQYTTTTINIAHQYYVKATFKVTNDVCQSIFVAIMGTSAGTNNNVFEETFPSENTEYELAGLVEPNSDCLGNIRVNIYHLYETAEIASGKVLEVENILIFDLTEIFGAGNEPTASKMDLIMKSFENDWFDETENIANSDFLIKNLTTQAEVDETIKEYHTTKKYISYKTYDVDCFNVKQGFSVYDAFATLLNSVKFDVACKQSEQDAFNGYSHDSTLCVKDDIGYSVFVSNLVEYGDNPTYDNAIVTLAIADFSDFTSESAVTNYEVAKQGDTVGAYTITSGTGAPNCYIVDTTLHIIYSAKLSDGNWYLIHKTFDADTDTFGTAETCNLSVDSVTYDYTTDNVNSYIPTTPVMYTTDTFISQNSQIAYYDGYYYTGMCIGQQIYSSVIMRTTNFITWEVWLKPTWTNTVRSQYEGSCIVFNDQLYYAMRLSENEEYTNTGQYVDQKMLIAKIDLTTKEIIQETLITGAYSRACWYIYNDELHLFHSIHRRRRSEDIVFQDGDLNYPLIVMQGAWEYIYPSFVVCDGYIAISCTGVGPNRVRLHKWTPDNYSVTSALNVLASILKLPV